MKLWLLTRKDDPAHDDMRSAVVRAKTPHRARKLANDVGGDEVEYEDSRFWFSTAKVTCKELKSVGKDEVVIVDFWEA